MIKYYYFTFTLENMLHFIYVAKVHPIDINRKMIKMFIIEYV